MVAETTSLAAIDSGAADADGIARVCEELGRCSSASGFIVERRAQGGLSARPWPAAIAAGPRVLIVGHADTVWPAGTAADWPRAA